MEDPDRVLVALEVEIVDQPPGRQQRFGLFPGVGILPRLRVQADAKYSSASSREP